MTTMTFQGAVTSSHKPGFHRLMLSELTKIRSVRSTVWSFILLVLISLGFVGLSAGWAAATWDDSGSEGMREDIAEDPTAFILGNGIGFGQLTICVLGVMVIASEYSTGMIRASVLAVPKRLPMLAAKCATFGLVVLGVGLVLAFAQFFLGAAIMQDKVTMSLSDGTTLRAVVGEGLYLAMLGLFALALGAIIRNTAAGITVVIGSVFVVGLLVALLPGKVGDYIEAYWPTNAGYRIVTATTKPEDLLSPWQGYGVFALWTLLLLVIGGALLQRRDA